MYSYRKTRWTKHIDFIVIDCILFEIALFLSVFIRFKTVHPADSEPFIKSALILLILILLVSLLSNNYSGILRRKKSREAASTLWFTTVVTGALTILLFILKISGVYSRLVYLMTWAFGSVFIFIARTILKTIIMRRPASAIYGSRRVLVVTTKAEAETILTSLIASRQGAYTIDSVVIVDEDMRGQEIAGVTVSASRPDIYEYIRSTEIDEVFLHIPDNRAVATFLSTHLKDMGITVHLSLSWQSESAQRNTRIESFGQYTVLTTSARIVPVGQLAVKRFIDIVGSIVGLIITGIALIFVAPMIKKQSPGPVFFKQERIGKNGKRFMLYKFRSMYPDAEARKAELEAQNEVAGGLMFKMKEDPRVFPFGQFMRNKSIDELPQFLNVLKGEMSLVGTRPPTVNEWNKYEYHYMKRLAIKPGITGLWQVSGRSDIKDFDAVVELDTRYIDEWSIGLDIKILFQTVGVVFKGSGAS